MYDAAPPSKEGYITVSQNPEHSIYWQEYGVPEGQPVLVLHGGPGSGAMTDQARLFDPSHYRIIMFDQRGAGKSTPHATLQANTTKHLIADINQIRDALNIDGKMHLFGGSWGSTLALAYAIQYPQNVKSIIVYGVFLGRKDDIDAFYQGNAATPNATLKAGTVQHDLAHEWSRYVEFIPKSERGDMIEAYHKFLTSDNDAIRLKAAQHWNRWERATSKRIYDEESVAIEPEDAYALAHARMENHYFRHGLFLSEDNSREQNYILEHAENLANIPLAIIQGAHDKVCPPVQAYALYNTLIKLSHKHQPTLKLIETAGHTMRDPGMIDALIEAADAFKIL